MSAPAIRLDGELTIYRAAEIKPLLLPLPAADGPVQIDLAEVSDIDSAGVQLLLLAEREAAAARREFRLLSPSAAVREVLTLLNLQTRLALPAA